MISSILELEVGMKGKILEIRGGRNVKQRLTDLGLTVGTEIILLDKSPFTGPILLLVRGSRLAIGRGIATKIIVQCS